VDTRPFFLGRVRPGNEAKTKPDTVNALIWIVKPVYLTPSGCPSFEPIACKQLVWFLSGLVQPHKTGVVREDS